MMRSEFAGSVQNSGLGTSSAAHLILLIGLPGSGKSSLTADLVQACPQRQVISTDAIRARLFGAEAIQGPWLNVWREVGYQFRQTVGLIGLGQVREAIYDATNVVRRQRRQAISLARHSGFTHITGLWLNVPLSICLARNQQRDRQVPEAIVLQMHRRLIGAPPSLQEAFDRLVIIGEGDTQMPD